MPYRRTNLSVEALKHTQWFIYIPVKLNDLYYSLSYRHHVLENNWKTRICSTEFIIPVKAAVVWNLANTKCTSIASLQVHPVGIRTLTNEARQWVEGNSRQNLNDQMNPIVTWHEIHSWLVLHDRRISLKVLSPEQGEISMHYFRGYLRRVGCRRCAWWIPSLTNLQFFVPRNSARRTVK